MHRVAVNKLLYETPTVLIVLLQLLYRAIILCATVGDAADKMYAAVGAVEGFALVLQTFVFIFMDAQKVTAPKMRIVFSLVMISRFLVSFYRRSFETTWAEEWPVGRGLGFASDGQASRRSTIGGIDWTCTLLMATSLVSVLLHPTELALVKLPSDVQGYMNWRDHYVRKMGLQAARRDQDVADAFLRLKAWFTHSRLAKKTKQAARARTSGGDKGAKPPVRV